MNYQKQNFVDGEVLSASQLNHMEDGIANAAGAGISETAKELMLSLFENATYKTDDAQDTLNALRAEWGFAEPDDTTLEAADAAEEA